MYDLDAGLQGFNLFIYCGNNPVNRIDSLGTNSEDINLDPTDDQVSPKEGGSRSGNNSGYRSTPIYRYGGTSPSNLRPSNNDVTHNSGLSFSTTPKPGSAMTTIEEVNATGILYAVQDTPFHVSVYPIGGTIAEWRQIGADSVWTAALKSIVTLYK